MDPRITKKARELGELLAQSDVFRRAERARDEMSGRSAAQLMLQDLQKKQERLRQKQLEGKEITQADVTDLQRTFEVVSMNPYVREFLQAQMAFEEPWLQVQAILAKAVGIDVPEASDEERGGEEGKESSQQEEDEEAARRTRSRLWVPGM